MFPQLVDDWEMISRFLGVTVLQFGIVGVSTQSVPGVVHAHTEVVQLVI